MLDINFWYIGISSFTNIPSCTVVIPYDKYFSCAFLHASISSSKLGIGTFFIISIYAFSSNSPVKFPFFTSIIPPNGASVFSVIFNISNAFVLNTPLCPDL